MANRRMFSTKIIDSARFLKMPVSAKLLYYDLGMRADDDGVVEGYNVLRMTGCTEDDLKILVAKQFVIVLNEDLVTYITDWNEHNLIRPDRKIDSIYKNLLLQIVGEVKLIEARPRADIKNKYEMDGQWTDNGQQMDSIGKDRLGEVSIGKDSINNSGTSPQKKTFKPPTLEEVEAYCKERSNKVDPNKWHDFYLSKAWMIGKNKMKDWKAAVRTWEDNNKSNKPTQQKSKFSNFENRDYKPDQVNSLEQQLLEKSRKEMEELNSL